MILDYLLTGEAYKVELIRKNGKIYCHITIDESKLREYTEENFNSRFIFKYEQRDPTIIARIIYYNAYYYWKSVKKKFRWVMVSIIMYTEMKNNLEER